MLKRRGFLAGLAAGTAAATPPPPSETPLRPPASTSGLPPRKVIVGTVMQPFWGAHPGLDKRLAELTAILDSMARESQRKYGRGLDLAILPETSISGEAGRDALAQSVVLDGPVAGAFAAAARNHRCYTIVASYFKDQPAAPRCSNSAVLFGRTGDILGAYRKVHLVVSPDGKTMEGGSSPGKDYPVFDCDFGKLAIQICYDMEFDRGWRELARQGAELIAWPTQSPQTSQPAARAMQQRCHIVSSTWRHNASFFEPTGKIIAQVKPPGQVLVQEIDLSFAILPWSSRLQNGRALQAKFGDRIGFRYYEDEDLGIFWSNDPTTPVRRMTESLGLLEAEDELARVRDSYRKAGMADY